MIKINNYIAGIQELVPCLKYWLDTFYYDLKSIIVIQLEKIESFFFFHVRLAGKVSIIFETKKITKCFSSSIQFLLQTKYFPSPSYRSSFRLASKGTWPSLKSALPGITYSVKKCKTTQIRQLVGKTGVEDAENKLDLDLDL